MRGIIRTLGMAASWISVVSRQTDAAMPSMRARPFGQQAAARFGLLITDDHARAGVARAQCSGQPGRPGTDDQHIAMIIKLRIAVTVRIKRRLAKAGRAADHRLEYPGPGPVAHGARPHECLVIKSSRQQG